MARSGSSTGPDAAGPTATAPDPADPDSPETDGDQRSEPAGSIGEIEPVAEGAGTMEPVGLDEAAEFGDGVVARLTSITSTELTAQVPGEISGPGVVIAVEITNGSDSEIDLDPLSVNLFDLSDAPLLPISTDPADPLSGGLAPGDTRTGRYVFTVPADDRDDVRLTLKYSADTPAVVLTGSLPR